MHLEITWREFNNNTNAFSIYMLKTHMFIYISNNYRAALAFSGFFLFVVSCNMQFPVHVPIKLHFPTVSFSTLDVLSAIKAKNLRSLLTLPPHHQTFSWPIWSLFALFLSYSLIVSPSLVPVSLLFRPIICLWMPYHCPLFFCHLNHSSSVPLSFVLSLCHHPSTTMVTAGCNKHIIVWLEGNWWALEEN